MMMVSNIGSWVVKNLYAEMEIDEVFGMEEDEVNGMEEDEMFGKLDYQMVQLLKDVAKNHNKGHPTFHDMSMLLNYCIKHDTQFVNIIVKYVDPLSLFDFIQIAHQFQMKSLMDLTCRTLVSMVKGKSATEIQTTFIMDLDLAWTNNGQLAKSAQSSVRSIMRLREKETLMKPTNFVSVRRSRLVAEALSNSYTRRWKFRLDYGIFKLLNPLSDEDLLVTTGGLAAKFKNPALADCLEHDHVVRLFDILEQQTSRKDIQSAVLRILSRVKFSAHEKAVEAARIQLLVKFINEKVFGTYDYEMTHRAVFTLTNIAKGLPKFVADILNTDVLERVKRVIVVRCTDEMVNITSKFLVAVCRSEDLSCLNKVNLARFTLQLLGSRTYNERHIEQSCHAFQYLTYGMELQIEELALNNLFKKLIEIIHEPPRGNCLYPGYALGVFGNIVIWGSLDQIKILTSNPMFLESLEMVMKVGSKKIQKEACQIISNVAARMDGLVEEMQTSGLIEALCRLLEKDETVEKDEFDVKMEAAWAIYNGIYGSLFSPSHSTPPLNEKHS